MLTFMPMMNYRKSMEALDIDILQQQTLYISSMIQGLNHPSRRNDPCTAMWKGHELALCIFGSTAAAVASERQGRPAQAVRRQAWFHETHKELARSGVKQRSIKIPDWVGDKDFHRSHRSNLMRINPEYYDWPGNPRNMPYLWPVEVQGSGYGLMVNEEDRLLLELGGRELPEWLSIDKDGRIVQEGEPS